MAAVTWLLATRNRGKIRELERILADAPIKIVGLDDLGINEESPESGHSFMENAMQKAVFYQTRAGMPVLADDSGLEVDALNGAPGIYSSRFGGLATHAEKCTYLLSLIKEIPDLMRTARFTCAAVYHDGHKFLSVQDSLEGFIGYEPIGTRGFGYDPIFHPEWDGPSLAQHNADDKNRISHRGKAFRALLKFVLAEKSGPG